MTFLNTGDFYGAGHNELLVGKVIKGRRDQAFISVKFGAIFHKGHWSDESSPCRKRLPPELLPFSR
nr:aldo/keto reductase [Xanthocytophaga flavus]